MIKKWVLRLVEGEEEFFFYTKKEAIEKMKELKEFDRLNEILGETYLIYQSEI